MSVSADDTGERQAALEALLADIASCRICRDAPLGGPANALPHEPRPVCVASSRAPILIAGQAPGTRVHQSGRPFTDPSGDRLRDWLGVDEAQFYDPDNFAIVPMGFCFPGQDAKGGDLPPRRECAPAWRGRVMEQMPQLKLILVIGQYAQAWHLGKLRQKSVAPDAPCCPCRTRPGATAAGSGKIPGSRRNFCRSSNASYNGRFLNLDER